MSYADTEALGNDLSIEFAGFCIYIFELSCCAINRSDEGTYSFTV